MLENKKSSCILNYEVLSKKIVRLRNILYKQFCILLSYLLILKRNKSQHKIGIHSRDFL